MYSSQKRGELRKAEEIGHNFLHFHMQDTARRIGLKIPGELEEVCTHEEMERCLRKLGVCLHQEGS